MCVPLIIAESGRRRIVFGRIGSVDAVPLRLLLSWDALQSVLKNEKNGGDGGEKRAIFHVLA